MPLHEGCGLCRQGFKGLKSIVLSTLFNCLDMHGSNPLWPTIGYQGAPPRRPRTACARSSLSPTWLPGHALMPARCFPARGAACLPPSAPGQVTCLHAFACLPGHANKCPCAVCGEWALPLQRPLNSAAACASQSHCSLSVCCASPLCYASPIPDHAILHQPDHRQAGPRPGQRSQSWRARRR